MIVTCIAFTCCVSPCWVVLCRFELPCCFWKLPGFGTFAEVKIAKIFPLGKCWLCASDSVAVRLVLLSPIIERFPNLESTVHVFIAWRKLLWPLPAATNTYYRGKKGLEKTCSITACHESKSRRLSSSLSYLKQAAYLQLVTVCHVTRKS